MKVKSSFYNELIDVQETGECLVYNLRSGGLTVLPNETAVMLKRNDILDLSEEHNEYLQELLTQGYLVPSDLDEKQQYISEYAQSQRVKSSNNSYISITVGTTILCNMGCPYCFQSVKPNKTLRDRNIIEGIVRFIEDMITSSPGKRWDGISVTWFGGEPLINKEGIEEITNGLKALAEKRNIPYDASIITNGILLDVETWKFLESNFVTNVQVTIDGAREVHNEYRPLKNKTGVNYERILENLCLMPETFNAVVRINTDKRVANSLEDLLNDFGKYGLWPQRQNSISLTLAWLKAYKQADNSNMLNLTQKDFFEVENWFSELKVKKYNAWAHENNKPVSKLKWRVPEMENDCPTWVSPYFFAIDPDGGVHKCWETLHDKEQSTGKTVLDKWQHEDYYYYTDYKRTEVHSICQECKFNPVCGGLSCAHDALEVVSENEFPCTAWKTNLQEYFKKMYLMMSDRPEEVALQKRELGKVNTTHANK